MSTTTNTKLSTRIRHWLGQPELRGLLGLLLVVAFAWGFVELADEVMEQDSKALDETVILAFRVEGDPADPIGPSWVEEVGRDITALGGFVVLTLISLVAVGYLLLQGNARSALYVAIAVSGGILVSTLLKNLFDRPRPDLVAHHTEVYTSSFPSGHSMMSAVVFLSVGALLAGRERNRRLKVYWLAVAVFLAVSVGISRIYLGVHWPTDVLAGWSAGAAWATACWLVMRELQRRGQLSAEGVEENQDPPSSAS